MRLFSSLVFLSLALVNASVSDCSKGASVFHPTTMSFSPDPAVTGKNATLSLGMQVPEQVENGTVTYNFKYNFIPLAPSTDLLCSVVPCPLVPGLFSTSSTYPIPAGLSGSLTIQITWNDMSNRQLLCVLIKTTVVPVAKSLTVYPMKPYLPLPMCPTYWNASFVNALRVRHHSKKNKNRLRHSA